MAWRQNRIKLNIKGWQEKITENLLKWFLIALMVFNDDNKLDKLEILWTSSERDVAMHFALMYCRVSK